MTAAFYMSLALMALCSPFAYGQSTPVPDAAHIVSRSAALLHKDWESAPMLDYCLTTTTGRTSTTHAVVMLHGTPYYRLVAYNGRRLSLRQEDDEQARFERHVQGLQEPNYSTSQADIQGYVLERARNQRLLEEFANAMNFELAGTTVTRGRDTYVVQASPKPGFRAQNRDTKVLAGIKGTLWVDREAFRWVRVVADVFKPVSIQGFIATVQPGTTFEIQQIPISDDLWMVSRFSMKADVRVFYFFHRRQDKEMVFFNYQPTGTLLPESCLVLSARDSAPPIGDLVSNTVP